MAQFSEPFLGLVAVTPHASNLIPVPNKKTVRGIIVAAAGNLEWVNSDGTSVTFAVVAGQLIPGNCIRAGVGTTATVVAGW